MSETTGISRRNAMMAAGVGMVALTLTGCEAGNEPRAGKCNAPKPEGKFDPFGLEPNEALWIKQSGGLPKGLPAFNPVYITLVTISSDHPWDLSVNQASFGDMSGMTDAEREAMATFLFQDSLRNGKRFRNIPRTGKGPAGKPYQIYERERPAPPRSGDPKVVDIDGFEYFGSNQQVEIYFLIDAAPGTGVTIDPAALISFAQRTTKGKDAAKNDRFFAREVSGHGLPGFLIAVRNYYCTFDEASCGFDPNPGPDEVLYAMNVHFALSGKGPNKDPIPMLIDPDTGNGMGWEPGKNS